MIGIDCSIVVTGTFASFLKSAGFGFVGRYYKPAQSHFISLSAQEAQTISDAGLLIVAVWEYCDQLGQLTPQQGIADAEEALARASATNQPADSVIYFAVDFSVTPEQITSIIVPYFQAIKKQFENVEGTLKFEMGVYGEGDTCTMLVAANLVTYTWLSGSSSFPGSAAYTAYHINQAATDIYIGDNQVDLDISLDGDIGAFQLPTSSTA